MTVPKQKDLEDKTSEAILLYGELTKDVPPHMFEVNGDEITEVGQSLESKMALFTSIFFNTVCKEFFKKLNYEQMDFKSFMRLTDEEEALFEKYLILATAEDKGKIEQ